MQSNKPLMRFEVESFHCKFCNGTIPPLMKRDVHERSCLRNPNVMDQVVRSASRVDMRSVSRGRLRVDPDTNRTVRQVNRAMRVITVNIGTKVVDQMDDLVHAGAATSRSEIIRSALNLFIAQVTPSSKEESEQP